MDILKFRMTGAAPGPAPGPAPGSGSAPPSAKSAASPAAVDEADCVDLETEGESCAICLEPLPKWGDAGICVYPCCGKRFHTSCDRKLMKSKCTDACPMCRGPRVRNFAEYRGRILANAQKGKVWAMVLIGRVYWEPRTFRVNGYLVRGLLVSGLPRPSPRLAMAWVKRAAQEPYSNAEAQYLLGVMLWQVAMGRCGADTTMMGDSSVGIDTVEGSIHEAGFRWLNEAATQGHPAAKHHIAKITHKLYSGAQRVLNALGTHLGAAEKSSQQRAKMVRIKRMLQQTQDEENILEEQELSRSMWRFHLKHLSFQFSRDKTFALMTLCFVIVETSLITMLMTWTGPGPTPWYSPSAHIEAFRAEYSAYWGW